MAKYKQVEFAELCGIPRTSLPPYIKSGQVIVEDKEIDEGNAVNQMFLQKCRAKTLLKKSNNSEQNTVETSNNSQENTISEARNKVKNKRKGGGSDYGSILIEMNELKNEKLLEEIELLKKRNMKMDGESIPTELVRNLFSIYGKGITNAQQSFSENWLTKFSKLKGLSSSEMAEMRGQMIKGLNDIVIKAQAESKKQIGNIIKEYSLSRGIGEHD